MKKFILFLALFTIATQYAEAQNRKIYVSKQGGKPKLVYGFKMGYQQTRYTNKSETCDTLICKGSGFERCFVDKNIFPEPDEETLFYKAFNVAIHKAEKHIKKSQTKEGNLMIMHDGQSIAVKYKNADRKGNADLEIEVL
jgi:hypothetical protein